MSWKLHHNCGHHSYLVVSVLLAVTYFGILVVAGFKEDPPMFNYDTLPKTSFSCVGKVPGRYYPDLETDCQLFHVCVKMSARDTHDFKFLCPNGTTFDNDHQVCMDYYQVVCHHEGTGGFNPLGHNFELMKLSSLNQNSGLDSEKISFVDPDVADRNTLGDDFQVDEHNTNRLATSQNTIFRSTKANRKPSSDIFYKNYDYTTKKPTTYYYSSTTRSTTSTTPRPTRPTSTTTTAAPALLFRSPIPSNNNGPSSSVSTKRKPNLETYESYEIESVAGLTPQNSFNQFGNSNNNGQSSLKHYDYSYEAQDPEPFLLPSSTTRKPTTSTTHRPLVFHNTFRSPLPVSSSTATPPVQTYQQQASLFNEDFFRKLPSSTETSVSKAAQFYVNSNTKYSTPSVRQPTSNPFIKSTTTEIPFHAVNKIENKFQYEPVKYSSQQNNDRGLSSRGSTTYETSGLIVNSTPRNHVIITDPPQDYAEKTRFSSQIVNINNNNNYQQEEDVIRPRSFSGNTNINSNQVAASINSRTRDHFSFSTISPPTTAEPYTVPSSTPFYGNDNNGVTYFQKIITISTQKPEKSSIFYNTKKPATNQRDYAAEKAVTIAEYTYEPSSTYRPPSTPTRDIDAGFGQKAGSSTRSRSHLRVAAETVSTTSTSTTTTTTERPQQRRGTRRRVQRPRHQQQQNHRRFDPELKYSRRIEPSKDETLKKKEDNNNDEIFNAEASVFPGRPSTNLFHEEKPTKVINRKTTVQPIKVSTTTTSTTTEASAKIAENYGRKLRVNTRRTYVSQHPVAQQEASSTGEDKNEQLQTSTPGPRRLIKRLKVKVTTPPSDYTSTTPEPIISTTEFTTTEAVSTTQPPHTTTQSFHTTLRPVKRINVKTKVGTRKYEAIEKDSEFRVPPVLGGESKNFSSTQTTPPSKSLTAFEKLRKLVTASSSSARASSSSSSSYTTTPEPELVTASDNDILFKKLKKYTTLKSDAFTTPTTFRPYDFQNSSVVIKVTHKAQNSAIPTPISFKEPILPNKGAKISRVEVKHSIREDSTKSPDYDYAYYDKSDDDYKDAASKLDSKNYGGKKSEKKASPSPV